MVEGKDDEEMKSSSVRINPKYLRIHVDRMHKGQPSLCTSAEEAMYRRGEASVLQNRVYSFFENHGYYFHGYFEIAVKKKKLSDGYFKRSPYS